MTSATFYAKLLTYIRKDTRGKSLTIDEFNQLIRVVNYELFNSFYDKWEKNQDVTDALSPFKVFNHSLTVATNKASIAALTLPYEHLIGKPRYSTDVTIDVVTALEYSERFNDALTKPSATYPVCFIADNAGVLTFYVYPTMSTVEIDYLRTSTAPFLDYYVNDTTYVVTYIAAGATAIAIPTGSTYRDGTTGPDTIATGATKDIEFTDDCEGQLLDLFLSKLGIQLGDEMLIQYSNLQQAKEA